MFNSENQIVQIILLILSVAGGAILFSLPGIIKELRNEKEAAKRYSEMTPEEIMAEDKIDINQKVSPLRIAGFIFSFAAFALCGLLGIYIISKYYLQETVGEIVIIVFSIAVGFCIMWFGIKKFGKDAIAMHAKEIRSMGKVKNYYLYTFIKSLLVIIGVAGVILFLWFLDTK
jgi:hypothetical protein